MNLNFEIPEANLWWRPSYWPYSNNEIFTKIEYFKILLNDAKKDYEFKSELEKTITIYYHVNYLMECLKGEQNIKENVSFDDVSEIIYKPKAENKTELKIKNIYNAIIKYCPDPFDFEFKIDSFNVEMAKDLNKIIGEGLWNNAGNFRTNQASTSNISYQYCKPEEISEKINKLFKETKILLLNDKLKNLESRIKIASMFFTIFLDIHPFSNGNGRVARILLSLILSENCCIPVSLNCLKEYRDVYLKCLVESRINNNYVPSALSAFILECVLINVDYVVYLLGNFKIKF